MCAKCLVQGGFQEGDITILQAFDEFIGEKKMQNLSSATGIRKVSRNKKTRLGKSNPEAYFVFV